jgi:hypothetical protein
VAAVQRRSLDPATQSSSKERCINKRGDKTAVTVLNLVFCSVFYAFYEQYLTIWEDTFQSIGLSLAAVFVATLVLTGFNIFSALIVLVMVAMVVINLGGLMYWWNVSLNAVSLVNLVMVSARSIPQLYL